MPLSTLFVLSSTAVEDTPSTSLARASRRRCARVGGVKADGRTATRGRNAGPSSKRWTRGSTAASNDARTGSTDGALTARQPGQQSGGAPLRTTPVGPLGQEHFASRKAPLPHDT